MSKLQRALKQAQIPGIYRFDSEASGEFLQNEAARSGWKLYVLDGAKISDKKSFLDKIARAMKFPEYFGKNWDALDDCLTDLEGTSVKGYILLFENPRRFMKSSPAEWAVAADVFKTAMGFWSDQKIPFYVLLRGRIPSGIGTL